MLQNGLCGSFSPDWGSNCSWVGTSAYPAALAAKCDIYTIMLGTNDAKFYNWFDVQGSFSPDFFALDYLELAKSLKKANPKTTIYFMVPIPLYVGLNL